MKNFGAKLTKKYISAKEKCYFFMPHLLIFDNYFWRKHLWTRRNVAGIIRQPS